MFKNPENALLVAITKLKLYEPQLGNREDIEDRVIGEKIDSYINLSDYQVCLVEADETETLQDMVLRLNNIENPKDEVKQGWIDYNKIV